MSASGLHGRLVIRAEQPIEFCEVAVYSHVLRTKTTTKTTTSNTSSNDNKIKDLNSNKSGESINGKGNTSSGETSGTASSKSINSMGIKTTGSSTPNIIPVSPR